MVTGSWATVARTLYKLNKTQSLIIESAVSQPRVVFAILALVAVIQLIILILNKHHLWHYYHYLMKFSQFHVCSMTCSMTSKLMVHKINSVQVTMSYGTTKSLILIILGFQPLFSELVYNQSCVQPTLNLFRFHIIQRRIGRYPSFPLPFPTPHFVASRSFCSKSLRYCDEILYQFTMVGGANEGLGVKPFFFGQQLQSFHPLKSYWRRSMQFVQQYRDRTILSEVPEIKTQIDNYILFGFYFRMA